MRLKGRKGDLRWLLCHKNVKLYTLFKTEDPENNTLTGGMSLYRKYMWVNPPPPPPPGIRRRWLYQLAVWSYAFFCHYITACWCWRRAQWIKAPELISTGPNWWTQDAGTGIQTQWPLQSQNVTQHKVALFQLKLHSHIISRWEMPQVFPKFWTLRFIVLLWISGNLFMLISQIWWLALFSFTKKTSVEQTSLFSELSDLSLSMTEDMLHLPKMNMVCIDVLFLHMKFCTGDENIKFYLFIWELVYAILWLTFTNCTKY